MFVDIQCLAQQNISTANRTQGIIEKHMSILKNVMLLGKRYRDMAAFVKQYNSIHDAILLKYNLSIQPQKLSSIQKKQSKQIQKKAILNQSKIAHRKEFSQALSSVGKFTAATVEVILADEHISDSDQPLDVPLDMPTEVWCKKTQSSNRIPSIGKYLQTPLAPLKSVIKPSGKRKSASPQTPCEPSISSTHKRSKYQTNNKPTQAQSNSTQSSVKHSVKYAQTNSNPKGCASQTISSAVSNKDSKRTGRKKPQSYSSQQFVSVFGRDFKKTWKKTANFSQRHSMPRPDFSSISLTQRDTSILRNNSNQYYTGNLINAASKILKDNYPDIDGFLPIEHYSDATDVKKCAYVPKHKFIQILHIRGNHFVTVSNIMTTDKSHFQVYDSAYSEYSSLTLYRISKLYFDEYHHLRLEFPSVQQQSGAGNNCGPYAIAFALDLLLRRNPANCVYRENQLRYRSWQLICQKRIGSFSNEQLHCNPASIAHSYVIEDLICICRLKNLNSWVCTKCKRRFHAACVSFRPSAFRRQFTCHQKNCARISAVL